MKRSNITRRAAIGRLGALVGTAFWPGVLLAQGKPTTAGPVRFVVLNDLHHENADCEAWFGALFKAAGAHAGVAFVAGLGDLANTGKRESLAAIKRLSAAARVPFLPVPGNHDNDVEENTRIYSEIFPGRLNYAWTEAGWQFIALDTTEGKKWGEVRVSVETLMWLKAETAKLDAHKPTVLMTHFPLGAGVKMRPLNAEAILEPLADFNLRGVFSGHFHSQTSVKHGQAECVTNVCCSRVGKNHDGTLVKGYFVVNGAADGELTREFVPFAG
jgi:3',5'-cyclic AMP phosphodiesterase CpdA